MATDVKAKFERARKGGRGRAMGDVTGQVRVLVRMADPNKPNSFLAGNINKTLTVSDAKVSDVFEFIEGALFGKDGG